MPTAQQSPLFASDLVSVPINTLWRHTITGQVARIVGARVDDDGYDARIAIQRNGRVDRGWRFRQFEREWKPVVVQKGGKP